MEIRDARLEDASSACQVVGRSISELCVADHGNDPAILKQWLNNKTPENLASWITHPDIYSGLMFANLITLAHFSVSAAMSLPKSEGEPENTEEP
jgi:hypothetical protein